MVQNVGLLISPVTRYKFDARGWQKLNSLEKASVTRATPDCFLTLDKVKHAKGVNCSDAKVDNISKGLDGIVAPSTKHVE